MTANAETDIETWREVHRHLTLAIIQSRDNVAAELAKRRYLLEEINRSPAGGLPSHTAQTNPPASKKVPKKASAGKYNKNTLPSSVKSVKQGKQQTTNNALKVPAIPLGVMNNSLPVQKKSAPMVNNNSLPTQKKPAPMAPPQL